MPGSHFDADVRGDSAPLMRGMAGAHLSPLAEAKLPPIYFYFPPGIGDSDIPASKGVFTRDRPGKYNWTVKTYGYLSQMGFPCQLTSELPDEGIIITHRQFFKNT